MENYKAIMVNCNVPVVAWLNLLGLQKKNFHLRLSAKLSNLSTLAKTYWSIFQVCINGKNDPLIYQLLVEKLVTNVLEETNIFNDAISQQCQPISNDSILPSIPTFYFTNNRLNDINFNYDQILRVIQPLDPN